MKNLHPNEYHPNRFDCDHCEKSFRIQSSLTSHVRRKHPKDGKVMKQSSSTIQHRKDGKVMKKSKFVSPFWSQRLVCEYCLKKVTRKYMNAHIQRVHQRANLRATQKAYANQQAIDQIYITQDDQQDGVEPEVPVVDTTAAVDNTGDSPDDCTINDCTQIVFEFIGCITGDQSAPTNAFVQSLLTDTDNELRCKSNYYIMMANVFKLRFGDEKKRSLMDFIDDLTETVRRDADSQYDIQWMIMVFTVGRELLRNQLTSRAEVEEMLIYFLYRADQDFGVLGVRDQQNNQQVTSPVFTV